MYFKFGAYLSISSLLDLIHYKWREMHNVVMVKHMTCMLSDVVCCLAAGRLQQSGHSVRCCSEHAAAAAAADTPGCGRLPGCF